MVLVIKIVVDAFVVMVAPVPSYGDKALAALQLQSSPIKQALRIAYPDLHRRCITKEAFAALASEAAASDLFSLVDQAALAEAAERLYERKLDHDGSGLVTARAALSHFSFGFSAAAGAARPIGVPADATRPLRYAQSETRVASAYDCGGIPSPRLARTPVLAAAMGLAQQSERGWGLLPPSLSTALPARAGVDSMDSSPARARILPRARGVQSHPACSTTPVTRAEAHLRARSLPASTSLPYLFGVRGGADALTSIPQGHQATWPLQQQQPAGEAGAGAGAGGVGPSGDSLDDVHATLWRLTLRLGHPRWRLERLIAALDEGDGAHSHLERLFTPRASPTSASAHLPLPRRLCLPLRIRICFECLCYRTPAPLRMYASVYHALSAMLCLPCSPLTRSKVGRRV